MTPLWTAAEIAEATGGTQHGEFEVEQVCFDSREVIGGELFVAMRGETTDGHRFVESAKARGAAGFLVSEPVDAPHVLVKDGLAALEALGRAARARTKAVVFGVTGSVGKTSVKEALRAGLAEGAPLATHASVKSYNNHTGVPLSLARMPSDSRFGIFEMGMNHAGELAALTRLMRPNVAVVTWVASAHREFFDSEEAIADAKAEIFEGLEPGGTAVLPLDNPHYERLRAKAERHAAHILTFGFDKGADVHVERSAPISGGMAVVANIAGDHAAFTLQVAGRHWILNSLAVLAAAKAAGADLAPVALGLAGLKGLAGRGEQHVVRWDGGEVRLIDESYNANPASMRAGLSVLGAAEPGPGGRRIAVLGAMRELGAESDRFHAELAGPLGEAKVDLAILVGAEMEPLAKAVPAVTAPDAGAALDTLRGELRAGDVVLFKGSNSVGLGRLVVALRQAEG